MSRILIIDDDEMICRTLALFISSLGHEVESALRLGEGMDKLLATPPDLVFLDVNLPDGMGLEAIPAIRKADSSPEVIIITGEGTPDGADLAIRSGAWDYVQKPLSIQAIRQSLSQALRYREEKAVLKSPSALMRTNIIGNSPEITRCLEAAAKAADTDVNVLITGETGTGKDLFARTIHENSRRAGRSFVVVDCAALPPTLVESVLFGHEKGSFTGADQGMVGLIRQAHEGTLFLDEVGELPLEIQKRFLRVLQEHRFRPIGSPSEVESRFRLVAATNRNLPEMAANGSFREDLLFRLRVLTLDLPSLRERRMDIPELALSHLARLCKRYQMAMKEVCPGFMEVLLQYDWPGNVRELFNVLENSLVATHGEPTLFAMHLPAEIRVKVKRHKVSAGEAPLAEPASHGARNSKAAIAPPAFPGLRQVRQEAVSEAERRYLIHLSRVAAGDLKLAASLSGLSRSQLYRLLRKYRH